MTIRFKGAVLAATLAALGAGTALAHGGGDDLNSASTFDVTRAEALDIAKAEGVVEVWEVKARRGVWEVEGADSGGAKLEIEIDGQTGDVVKFERYGKSGSTP
jgi:uncharacterized membrane protein YkoI